MPQIAQLSETYASQIFWVLLFFGLIFFVIGKGMVPKVMETVAVRDKQIADDLAAAEAARKAADSQEEAWRVAANTQRAEAQALIAKAKGEAAKATETRLASANTVIDQRLAEAEQRIAGARAGALEEIETVATEAAGDIVARLAGVTVDAAAARVAVKEALNG
ncbi:ATPase [Novosphingobium sp. PS1R-30]|uniref:ATP synthase subunit b n=1 Tax=Novosphingobium anseongense TaxID=3133436 RepID=A0ABU8S0A1_9SPHN|nr:MAG: ATPase [Novosphingobium sp.]